MRTHITCALLLSVCWTARAHAFADARLTSVAAELDVRQPEAARVELLLGLDVRSSWLSSLPLRGLDPDLRLLDVEVADAARPEVVEAAPGELWLRWPDRRSAPRRGTHSLRLTYQTQQLAAADAAKLEWALPRWPVSLSGVQVRVIGPTGLEPLPPARENLGEHVERDASSLTFTRVELPRTEPYRVGFAIPQAAAPQPNSLAALRPQTLATQLSAELPELWAASAIGLVFACLVLLKRRTLRAGDSALLPQLIAARHDGVVFGLCALAPLLATRAPNLALACALLGVTFGLARRGPAADGGKPEAAAQRRRPMLIAASLDATRALGWTTLSGVWCAAWLSPEPARTSALAFAWLATPLFFSGCAQPAFLRRSSTTVSRSLSSRPTASGAGSKSTNAACTSS